MSQLTKKHVVFGLILGVVAATGFAADGETQKPKIPNIVFILADDLGWADLSCYGSTFYETPNLDKLAAQGMRFTDAYAACSVCSPTRASIMTGKYPARLHLTDYFGAPPPRNQKLVTPEIQQFLPLEEFTVAEALKEGGYKTGFIGKWHLGDEPKYYPDQQGFDVNIAGCGKGHPKTYFSPYRIPMLEDGPQGEYLTHRLTDEALKFIEQSKDKPFFLYLSHYAVHTPIQAEAALVEKYKLKAEKLPPGKPGQQRNPEYAAMVEGIDQGIGRIMEKLKSLGLEENTVILFTSDNGGLAELRNLQGNPGPWPTSNLPLRAGKGWPYEGGVREPLLVKWPGVVKPGSVANAPVISTDYYPTLLQIAGLPPRPEQHCDGQSIVPVLQGGVEPGRPLFWHYPHYCGSRGGPNGAVRLGDFKLLQWYEDMRVELFDLKNDLGEQTDLAAKMPAKADELRKALEAWRISVNAEMPVPNPAAEPADSHAEPQPSATPSKK